MLRPIWPRAAATFGAAWALPCLVFGLQPTPPRPAAPDSVVTAAEQALAAGRPWQATRLIAPLVRDPAATAPVHAILAGKAATGWEGWATVTRLLFNRPWLDLDSSGTGHALLGRALLERSDLPLAQRHTRQAVALASDPTRGERLVWHARALDRAGLFDSAGPTYRAAAGALPNLADWLLLRAAGVTADSNIRDSLFGQVRSPAARARIPWTDALALERRGDSSGAARRYSALGARLAAARLRLGGDRASREQARAELLALLASGRPAEETAEVISLLDRWGGQLAPADELRLARRAAAIDLLDRAARAFDNHPGRLTDRDRFVYATVLSRLGRFEQALPLFDAVRDVDLKGDAQYQRARMLIRNGQTSRALASLRAIPSQFPADSEPAASALFLLADLYADRGVDDSARALFLEASRRYPSTPFGQRAGLQAGLIAWLDGDHRTALVEFERIAATPGHSESLAAAYWAGRTAERLGDSANAARRLNAVIGRGWESYYAARAARRLGLTPRSLPPRSPTAGDSVPAALSRVRELNRLGLRAEARFELEGYIATAGSRAEPLLATARELARDQWHAHALRTAQRARSAGATDTRGLMELLYPLPFRDLLETHAARAKAPLWLIAGLIRQESLFDPAARSLANARGLMQVLPSVGAAATKSLGIDWDPSLLYQPDLNLDLGVRHLDEALDALGWPERALAGYNGGVDRVQRWRSIRGTGDDAEMFVERIPFSETRDYVRKVLANEAVYTALYPAGSR